MHSNKYTMFFTVIMCLIISTLLAGTSALLKERQVFNKEIDIQKNILIAAGIPIQNISKVESLYKDRVRLIFINTNGQVIHNEQKNNENNNLKLFEIYDQNTIVSYVYPIEGKGLWSSLYGYLSVDPSGAKIIGITFYKHGETPGLGAEIEKLWFRENFIGKKLYKNSKFIGITIAKSKAKYDPSYKIHPLSVVDGISGATITSKGVEKMLCREPQKYHNFFN